MGHTHRDDVAQTSPMEELAHNLLVKLKHTSDRTYLDHNNNSDVRHESVIFKLSKIQVKSKWKEWTLRSKILALIKQRALDLDEAN